MHYLNFLEANKRAKRLIKRHNWYYGPTTYKSEEEIKLDELRRLRKTHKRCSCYMCGNIRKYFGKKTKQEILAEFSAQEQLNNIDI